MPTIVPKETADRMDVDNGHSNGNGEGDNAIETTPLRADECETDFGGGKPAPAPAPPVKSPARLTPPTMAIGLMGPNGRRKASAANSTTASEGRTRCPT